MVLRYLNYDSLNISEELEKINYSKEAEVLLLPTDKRCLFVLGMLFASGIKIKLINEKELNLTETNKSFSMMPYVWSKLSDCNFPDKYYSNVDSVMEERVENIKRLGVRVTRIENNPIENKIFLICPVRNATEEQKIWIENFVQEKYNTGYIIHAPHLHTRQKDIFGGYAICRQNAEALASSEEVDIYYDKSSTGSVFDLGVAYALGKPLKILNKKDIMFNVNDFMDNILITWPYKEKINSKRLIKRK